MSPRDRARRWHLAILAFVAGPALGFAVYLFLRADASGSTYSGIATALALAVGAGALAYALVTTAIVWAVARAPRDAVLVHVTPAVLGLLIFLLRRLG